MTGELKVIVPGRTVVTDLGRTQGSGYGLATNGALDQRSARVANALVGNLPNAPLLELTAFDFVAQIGVDTLIAVTGADAHITVDHRPVAQWEPVFVHAGQTLAIHSITNGLRTYLAFFGSLDAPRLLGSCAPDTVLGFGSQLAINDRVPMLRSAPEPVEPTLGVVLFKFPKLREPQPDPLIVDVTDGPDVAEFGDTARLLFAAPFVVGLASNHVGLRFKGNPPRRQLTGEVLSRGVPIGAVEVPPGDEVLILHRGRGVTAGYPVLGVVSEPGLDALAQARPGASVQFRHVKVEQATAQTRTRRAAVANLADRVRVSYSSLGLYARAIGDPRWSMTPTAD